MPNDKVTLPRKHQGLTLIELLVAITVLAVIALLGWRGLDSIVRARMALNNDLEQTRGMQLTFAQLQSDCTHLAGADILPDRLPLQLGQGRLTLVRSVFNDRQPTKLQVVDYRIRDNRLLRRESQATRDLALLDTLWQKMQHDADVDQAQGTPGAGVVLQSGLAELNMRLWIRNGWQQGTAAPLSNVNPPAGLEVAFRLQNQEGNLLKVFLLGAG